ncbi:prephenate dehydrogenase [Enterococcus sp. LJL98]
MRQKVLIVGLGLIGSSLASCIKNAHPEITLYGWDYQEKTKQMALKNQVVDVILPTFSENAQQAEIILLAVPVKTSLSYLKELSQLPLRPNVLVTDAGSTKSEIVAFADQQPYDFIGGHPMAGSHKSGILAQNPDLFENAYYIFTPGAKTAIASRVQELMTLLQGTRAKFLMMSAQEHDEITGVLSHFPHVVAAALVNQAEKLNQVFPRSKQLAAGGFRDITRIASSDPKMWTDILLSNRAVLIDLIQKWQANMTEMTDWLIQGEEAAIYTFFEEARETRNDLPVHEKGAIPSFYDIFIDIPDSPGVIGEVTSLLGFAKLSLINLRILETREEIMGILQLSFKNERDQHIAQQLIQDKTNYDCWIK